MPIVVERERDELYAVSNHLPGEKVNERRTEVYSMPTIVDDVALSTRYVYRVRPKTFTYFSDNQHEKLIISLHPSIDSPSPPHSHTTPKTYTVESYVSFTS